MRLEQHSLQKVAQRSPPQTDEHGALTKTTTNTILAPEKHPRVKTIGRMPIYKFLRERELYLRNVQEAWLQGSSFRPIRLVESWTR